MKAFIEYKGLSNEGVIGFLNIETGMLENTMKICNERDIDKFIDTYDITAISIIRR